MVRLQQWRTQERKRKVILKFFIYIAWRLIIYVAAVRAPALMYTEAQSHVPIPFYGAGC